MKRVMFALGLFLLFAVPVHIMRSPSTPIRDDYLQYWKDLPNGEIMDSWGNGIRQCTSWVSWRLYTDLHYKTDRWGEAYLWVEKAPTVGLIVDKIPSLNSAMVDDTFYPGHIMWVEKLNPDGTIHVSQYNADGKGFYSEEDRNPDGYKFIHFPKIMR